ncbi:MAG: hypothetical protein N2317_04775 [Syntrophales bacterium]|nr:hypothetical protein [Syntrophales bacterium]
MKKRQKAIMWLCLVVSFFVVPYADAFEIGVRGYLWLPDLKTADVKTIQNGIEGSYMDAKELLGLGKKMNFAGEIYGGIGRHHGSIMYTTAGFSDNTVLTADVVFNGVKFSKSTNVKSDYSYDMLDLKYQYDIINMENLLAGFSLGPILQGKFVSGELKLNSATTGDQRRTYNSVFPMVGVGAHIGLVANLLEARVQVTGGGYGSDNYSLEGLADVSVSPLPFVDINVGYRIVKIFVDKNDFKMDQFFSGPYLGLTVGF